MMLDPPNSSDYMAASNIVWPEDGKDMVFIPRGTLIMGSDDGSSNHQPEHRVYVADFYIDRWSVTNAEYKRFADATDHPVPNYDVTWCDTEGYNWDQETRMYPEGKADRPVVLVTWDDAMKSDFQYVKDIDQMSFDTPAPIQRGEDGIYPAPQPGRTKEI